METQTTFKLWSYDFVHYVPVTPNGGGDIQWHKESEYREIYLPPDISNPEKYLQQCGEENDADLLEYSCFNLEE